MGVPFSPKLREALDLLDVVSREVQLEFVQEPGEIVIANNLTLVHGRSSFENNGNPAEKRLMLRLWLGVDGARKRPRVPELLVYEGDNIAKQEGRRPTYDGKAWDHARFAKQEENLKKKQLVS